MIIKEKKWKYMSNVIENNFIADAVSSDSYGDSYGDGDGYGYGYGYGYGDG